MTIKPKKPRSGKAFGTRRQWRKVWRDRVWPLWMLEGAPMVFDTFTGRIIPDIKFRPMPDVSPWIELSNKIHEEMMAGIGIDFGLQDQTAFTLVDYSSVEMRVRAHYVGADVIDSRIPDYQKPIVEAMQRGEKLIIDKRPMRGLPAYAVAPYGKPKDTG